MELDLAGKIAAIVVIDLVLSGDNAMVIGMASRRLSPENRKRAIMIGGLGAVGLRVFFTALAAILLDVPLLQAFGAILLLWIAVKLLRPVDHTAHVSEADSLSAAIKTIILADVVMSLDNILAVGGAAHGDLELLIFGLVLSIPILLAGSELVARLLGRFPVLVYVGSVVLVITAVRMFFHDDLVHDFYAAPPLVVASVAVVCSAAIVGWSLLAGRRMLNEAPPEESNTSELAALQHVNADFDPEGPDSPLIADGAARQRPIESAG